MDSKAGMSGSIIRKLSGLSTSNQSSARIFWTLVGLAIVSMFLKDIPVAGLLVGPLNTFTTAIHEMSHALACLATGGHVDGLTIVGDGAGHGGLTFCKGGNPYVYTPAGYLGTALFGSFLMAIANFPRVSKLALLVMGVAIGLASLVLMPGAIFQAGIWQASGSVIAGLIMGGGLIWAALKLKPGLAHLLLLFLAVQTGLNAVNDVYVLAIISLGLAPGAWSDASNMQQLTSVPAIVWACAWALLSLAMLAGAAFWSFKRAHKI